MTVALRSMVASSVASPRSAHRSPAAGRGRPRGLRLDSQPVNDVPDLYDRATRGDPIALDALLEEYLPRLHAFVSARLGGELRAREGSMDVVQSVCRELLDGRDGFDFAGEDRFRAWLFTAALNKVRERHRRLHAGRRDARREVDDQAIDLDLLSLTFTTPSQEAIAAETGRAIRAALDELREDHREVITLARLARLPHPVIAELMGRSEVATRQLLSRAMVQLVGVLRRRGVDVERWRPRGGSGP